MPWISTKVRYELVANPASGNTTPERKRLLLAEAASILGAKIHGLEARTPEEFRESLVRVARECDVLVVAGGDGTLSMIINTIDRSSTPVGFLPMGSGNAMRHALDLEGDPASVARKIRDASVRQFDLIEFGGRVGFSASIGIESAVLRIRNTCPRLKRFGFCGYLFAAILSYFRVYKRIFGTLRVEGAESQLREILSLVVAKHPFHGFGMKIVPGAKLDDGTLHVLAVNTGFWKSIFRGCMAFFTSNLIGQYQTGKRVNVALDRPHLLQADGEEWWEGQTFRFEVLPRAVMVKA